MIEVRCLENDSVRLETYETVSLIVIEYEPANLTVHPPPRTAEGGFIFLYRCLVFPKKCPKRKTCAFRSYIQVKSPKTKF